MPVAPIQQGKSYSDMVNEQIGLIQQQRSANLDKRLAQEETNREFRQEQQQNIYDFDVSGLPQAYIEKISELQGQMASWLDPKADVHYEDSQQLTRDVAKLNNIYMSGKRLAAQGQPAMKAYEDRMLGKTKTPGVTSTATEDTYRNRRGAYDQGGFGGMELVGGPGEVGLFGVPMIEGENGNWSAPEEGERVDILSSQIDPFSLFRQEEIRDFINVEQKYVDEKDSDMAVLRAESDFNSNPESVQAEFRVRLANEDESWLEKNDDGSFKKDTAALLELYKAEAKSGWDKFHSTELPPSLLGGSATQTEYGNAIKLTDPKTGKDRTVSLISSGERRTVTNVGFSGKGDDTQVFYIYTDPDNPNGYGEAVVPFNSLEGMSLINDTGSIGAIAKMVGVSVDDLENINPVANSGDASTVNEGSDEEGDEEGGEEGEEEGEEDVVQTSTEPAVNPIDNYKSAINSLLEVNPFTGTTSGSGDLFRSDLGKLANRIKDMSIAQQTTEVNKEIRRLRDVQSQERSIHPESYQRSQTWKNADKSLKKLEEVQSIQEGLDTPENRDIAVEDIRTRIDEKKQELIESENISDNNSRSKTRDRINQEIIELEQGLEGLDLFANREESNSNTAIQGEGAGIAYSKPRPPQDISLLEVGNASSGSTPEEREFAFGEATRMAREAGHPFPEVVAAQFAKESAYGKKTGGKFNYFGLKSGNAIIERLKDAGIVATAADKVNTNEIINDETVTIKDSFLSFESPEDGFMAYLIFIDTVKKESEDGSYVRRYGPALDEAETAYDYIKQINELGYSTTSPTVYADSTNAIAQGFGVDLREITRKPQGTASN